MAVSKSVLAAALFGASTTTTASSCALSIESIAQDGYSDECEMAGVSSVCCVEAQKDPSKDPAQCDNDADHKAILDFVSAYEKWGAACQACASPDCDACKSGICHVSKSSATVGQLASAHVTKNVFGHAMKSKSDADYTPGEGCCIQRQAKDLTFTQSYDLDLDEMVEDIPKGSQCNREWTGLEAQLMDGNWIQDMRTVCILPDGSLVRLRSLNLMLSNGTTVNAGIISHADGTVDAKCDFADDTVRLKTPLDDDMCIGPKYHDSQVYVGPFAYGSAPVERYSAVSDTGLNEYVDFDVQNGCIPVNMGEIRVNNWVLGEHQVLPDGTFDIPQECYLQGGRALPKWVRMSTVVQKLV
jgi:hypothetical protein